MLPRSFAKPFTYNTTEILIIFIRIHSHIRASTSSSTYLLYSDMTRWVGGSYVHGGSVDGSSVYGGSSSSSGERTLVVVGGRGHQR